MASHNVLGLSMAHTSPSSPHQNVLLIISIEKDGIQSSCREWWTIRDSLWIYNVGWPGRVHDARVFCNSAFYYKGQNNTLFPDWKEKINDVDVTIVVLGDPAYPLLSWCMKAYPDTGSLSPSQRRFNYCKARVVVEHSYGKLKVRWRCLLKRLDVLCEDVPKLVAACCVLHNVCEIHGDAFDSEWLDGVGQGDGPGSISPSNTEENEKCSDDIILFQPVN